MAHDPAEKAAEQELDEEIGPEQGAHLTREVIAKVAWAGARSAYG